MDLFESPAAGPDTAGQSNVPEFTVGEISGAVKRTLEGQFGRIRVRGEVGRVVRARSGHIYYDLKDDRNVIACNTWKGQVPGLGVLPEEGLEVIVTGKISAYGGQSKYNMIVDSMEVAGEGALMAMLEKRKKQLAGEGLFDPARKQPLPFLPEVIGVITSPTGAVIRDILHRLADRFPRHVLIWPVAVQGKPCAGQVAQAIHGFNQLPVGGVIPRPDVLIVARGGGSLEDLWGFNEEVVVRAAAASRIPLISAVGHETDTTLIDFASDKRAPTPTAAAEMAVPVRRELAAALTSFGARMDHGVQGALRLRQRRLTDVGRALPRPDSLLAPFVQRLDLMAARLPASVRAGVMERRMGLSRLEGRLSVEGMRVRLRGEARRLEAASMRLDAGAFARRSRQQREALLSLGERMERAMGARMQGAGAKVSALERMLESLSYKATLSRGYAVVRSADGLVTSAKEGSAATQLEFADGIYELGARPAKVSKPKSSGDAGGGTQGSLF